MERLAIKLANFQLKYERSKLVLIQVNLKTGIFRKRCTIIRIITKASQDF